MVSRPIALLAACVVTCGLTAPSAAADPEAEPVATEAPPEPAPAPVDDGREASTPPATTTSPDGWVLTVSATDETQRPVPPLTTALSSRDYIVGGTVNASLTGPEEDGPPHGTLEVGYQIGCGIDMSTSQGVTMATTVGGTPSLGLGGVDIAGPLPERFSAGA